MKTKRLLSALLCLILAMALFAGCQSNSSADPAPAEAPAGTDNTPDTAAADPADDSADSSSGGVYNVGYSNMQVKEDFFITVESGIRKAAEDMGYEYNTTISDRDATVMKQNIEALVTKGADIIIDFNVMEEVGSAIAADLAKEDIPMLSVDCIYDGAYFFGVNNMDAGRILGRTTVDLVNDKFGGEIEWIVNVYDAASGAEVQKRNDGVVEVLQQEFDVPDDNVIWLDSAQDDVKSQTMTRDWLNSHPDATKIVVVGQNDDRGYAANAAVEAEARKDHCIVVSHNADPASVENLQKHVDDRDTAWLATASYNSHLYGVQIIDMATRILNGENVVDSEYTEVTIVTLDNVDSYVAERDEVMASLA